MARQREFERDTALNGAVHVFWAMGYAATSTDDLLQSMGIGRQSFYNAFGSKRAGVLGGSGGWECRHRLREPSKGCNTSC